MQTTTEPPRSGKKNARVLTVVRKWLERHKMFLVISFDSMVLTKRYLLLQGKTTGLYIAGTKRLFGNGWIELDRM